MFNQNKNGNFQPSYFVNEETVRFITIKKWIKLEFTRAKVVGLGFKAGCVEQIKKLDLEDHTLSKVNTGNL